jgi:hypothetical protein
MYRLSVVTAAAAIGVTLALGAPAASAASASCPTPPDLPAAFSPQVTNPYLPLEPGTTFKYKGKLDGEPAKDILSITDQTKTILGVATTVVHDQVIIKGDLVEDTFDWFAQDADGNVWYFGEDTKELDHGQVVSTEGSWEAGVNDAKAGIFMPAVPDVGQVFKQEDAPDVAEDCTKIAELEASIKTPYVSSNEALKTEEFSLLEPGVLDNKYYVRGVGLVAERTVQGGTDFLNLVLVKSP